ncbi:MAG TPA: NAD(P)/FAD-dependent oxidoreductase [Jatrophihabitantaceae bacterium]|nr:NAD(P)/FAD-dependent oxidoreductase [Jatrophihabitantaceae bacterium]
MSEPIAQTYSVDLLIVGAGPVGLFGAYYAGVRTMSTVVLDSLEEPGGQITAMYPEKAIFDVAGFPAIKGRDLVEQLVAQAAPHQPTYLLGHQAVGLERDGQTFVATTSAGARIECRAIVITGGIGTFSPRPLPTGGGYLGRGLAHFVPDPSTYADCDIVVVGGGDSALDWALMLEPIGRSVTIVHRRAEFRGHPHSVELLKASSVDIVTDAQVADVRGEPNITEVDIDVQGEIRTLPCDRLVAALGFTANLGPLMEWGIDIRKRQIVVDTMGRTSVPGIYAAGDIVDYDGKVKLIATGFGEVATAVNNAAAYLNPKVSAFPGHLSDYAPESGSPTAAAATS